MNVRERLRGVKSPAKAREAMEVPIRRSAHAPELLLSVSVGHFQSKPEGSFSILCEAEE